jgi:hypothetical protein
LRQASGQWGNFCLLEKTPPVFQKKKITQEHTAVLRHVLQKQKKSLVLLELQALAFSRKREKKKT